MERKKKKKEKEKKVGFQWRLNNVLSISGLTIPWPVGPSPIPLLVNML